MQLQHLTTRGGPENLHQEKQKKRKTADATAQSEKLAVIAAIELMYPHEFRADDVKLIAERKTTQKALALHFHVPEYVIGSALHPGRMEFATFGWSLVKRALAYFEIPSGLFRPVPKRGWIEDTEPGLLD